VPIDDTGGGARWTQIALELIRRHFLVVFIHKFPKYERVDLNLSVRHPNLVAASLDGFRWERFEKQHAALLSARPVTALAELPLAGFLPLLEEVRGLGGVTVYDLLDDWATSLGGEWYTEASEQQVIETSAVLVATAPALQERLERRSGRAVRLLPNAVNSFLFDPGRFYPAPADLPPGAWRAIYTGALWGEWFDWELLLRTARAYPQAAVVVIGDYAGQCPDPPPNLHFLGLKAQRDLPAYLAHAQVALLPWRITPITQATSPLKVYEYIAMQKPVVAPDLRPLHGLPGVSLIQGAEAFIAEVGAAAYRRVDEEAAIRFVNENDWQKRVADLLALAQAARQAPQAGRQKSGQAGFRKSGQARHG
jgi:glycosyltransferase involved in cell wall biosynthesis